MDELEDREVSWSVVRAKLMRVGRCESQLRVKVKLCVMMSRKERSDRERNRTKHLGLMRAKGYP